MAAQTMSLGSVSDTVPGGLTGLAGWDLSDHSSLAPIDLGVSILFLVLIPIFMGLRLSVRILVVRKVGWDDVLLIAATIFALPFYALIIFGVSWGLGRHIWDLIDFSNIMGILPRVKKLVLVLWINNHLYSTALCCVKCSIVACYFRVFPHQRLFRKTIWANTGVILALWVCSIFVGIFQCNPPQAAWEVTFKGAHCIAIVNYYYPANSVNIVTDLVLCIAPLPILWKLRVSKVERIFVVVLFCFGFFATAASIARLVTLTRYVIGGEDFTRYTSPTLIWSGVEIGVAIVCATVPALRPILGRLNPRRSHQFSFRSWKIKTISSKTRTSATSRTAVSQPGFEMVYPKGNFISGGSADPANHPALRPDVTATRFSAEQDIEACPSELSAPYAQKSGDDTRAVSPLRTPGAAHPRAQSFSRPQAYHDREKILPAPLPADWEKPELRHLQPTSPRLSHPQTRVASRTSFYHRASESLGLGEEDKERRDGNGADPEKKDLGMMTRIYEGSTSSGETFLIDR